MEGFAFPYFLKFFSNCILIYFLLAPLDDLKMPFCDEIQNRKSARFGLGCFCHLREILFNHKIQSSQGLSPPLSITPHISYLPHPFFIIDHVPISWTFFYHYHLLLWRWYCRDIFQLKYVWKKIKYLLLPSLLGEPWSLFFCLVCSFFFMYSTNHKYHQCDLVFYRQHLEQDIPDIGSKFSWEFTDVRYSSYPKSWMAQSAKQGHFSISLDLCPHDNTLRISYWLFLIVMGVTNGPNPAALEKLQSLGPPWFWKLLERVWIPR